LVLTPRSEHARTALAAGVHARMASQGTAPRIRAERRLVDRIFSNSALTAGALILAILAAVAAFLLVESVPALTADPDDVNILNGEPFWSYVAPLVFGTLWASALALAMAVPVSIGIALFISHYAPRRLAQGLGYIIDLLAARSEEHTSELQ